MAENRFNFAQIEQELEMIIERFAENQNLLKLLYYNDKNALEKEDITDEKVLNEILRQNIKIIPEIKIPERQNSFIIITFDSYEKNYSNPEFIDNTIYIDVLCPLDEDILRMNKYMLRPQLIMSEIQKEIAESRLTGIGKVEFYNALALNLGTYWGYRMAYSVINNG